MDPPMAGAQTTIRQATAGDDAPTRRAKGTAYAYALTQQARTCPLRCIMDRRDREQATAPHGVPSDEHQRLQDVYESLEAFTYVVAHDLKEPVRGMMFYLEELAEDPAASDHDELARRALGAGRDLQRLLDGLLEWSRTTQGSVEPRAVRVNEVVRDSGCSVQWQTLLEERHARLHVQQDIPPVMATEALLCRILGNLITNAIRHNPAEAPGIWIRGDRARADRVEVVVEDDGPGLPPHLVARHGRQPTSLKRGFGIAIAQRAVERLGGTMRLENGSRGGARVRIELPAAAPPEPVRTTLLQRVRDFV